MEREDYGLGYKDMESDTDITTRVRYLCIAVEDILVKLMETEEDPTQRMIMDNQIKSIRGFPYAP